MEISLKEGGRELDPYFKHSTNGEVADFRTLVSLERDADYLHISFSCLNNSFTKQNTLREHNAPLYQQEVFEVFLSAGEKTPELYWEIEINPHGAVWIGEIENTAPGKVVQRVIRNLIPEDFGLEFHAEAADTEWSGKLSLPFSSIGMADVYRVNFYRIRSRSSHEQSDWACDPDTCDFVCWQSTLSGDAPAFHRPDYFGVLKI